VRARFFIPLDNEQRDAANEPTRDDNIDHHKVQHDDHFNGIYGTVVSKTDRHERDDAQPEAAHVTVECGQGRHVPVRTNPRVQAKVFPPGRKVHGTRGQMSGCG
jgi:hypothetical protein